MSQASGVAKFSGEAIGSAKADFDEAAAKSHGEQLPLIADDDGDLMPDLSDNDGYVSLPDAGEVLEIQMETGMELHAAITEHRRRKGAGGRKKGSKNRSSEDFQRYLLQFGPQPGVTMMRCLARPVEQLAAELGCSKKEAMQMQIRCDDNLMPYFVGKMPVAIDIRATGDFALEIGDFMGAAIPAVDTGSSELELGFAENEDITEFQELSDDDTVKSE